MEKTPNQLHDEHTLIIMSLLLMCNKSHIDFRNDSFTYSVIDNLARFIQKFKTMNGPEFMKQWKDKEAFDILNLHNIVHGKFTRDNIINDEDPEAS